jgi:hypothetical protein
MLINFKQFLKNSLTNEDIYLTEEKKEIATLSDVCVTALLTKIENENLDGGKKFEYWELAKKINKAEAELKAEEIAIIKERLGRVYPQVIVGCVYDTLNV